VKRQAVDDGLAGQLGGDVGLRGGIPLPGADVVDVLGVVDWVKSRCVAARSDTFIVSTPAARSRWKSWSLVPGPSGSGGEVYGWGTHTGTCWQLVRGTHRIQDTSGRCHKPDVVLDALAGLERPTAPAIPARG